MKLELQSRLLERAAEALGGNAALRNRLGVPEHSLELWLAARAAAPQAVIDTAVELVLRADMAKAALAPPTKILVATVPEVAERLTRVLRGHDLHIVSRLDEAIAAVNRTKFGMIIICVQFDESRMFDLLHHVRINRKEPAVPVVCVLGLDVPLSDLAVQGLDQATKALMANAFLDLRKMSDEEKGNRRLRRIVDHLILVDGDMHQGLKENNGQ